MFASGDSFYLHNAALLALTVSLVCLSVTGRYASKRDERINLVFGMEASFDQSYTVI